MTTYRDLAAEAMRRHPWVTPMQPLGRTIKKLALYLDREEHWLSLTAKQVAELSPESAQLREADLSEWLAQDIADASEAVVLASGEADLIAALHAQELAGRVNYLLWESQHGSADDPT